MTKNHNTAVITTPTKWLRNNLFSVMNNRPVLVFRFIVKFIKHHKIIKQTFFNANKPKLTKLVNEVPELLGTLIWPFVCIKWNCETKLSAISSHIQVLDKVVQLNVDKNQKLIISDLSSYFDGLKVVIDRPKWFLREGLLTVNLFIGNFRLYTIAFNLDHSNDNEVIAVIGAIQGRNTPDINMTYKTITKSLYGIRPRDLIVEVLKIVCEHLGINMLLAVNDDSRIHRDKFFATKDSVLANYDSIWADRSGMKHDQHFYSLPLEISTRDLSTIQSKKRSQYRKRNLFLTELNSKVRQDFEKRELVSFDAE